MVRSFCPVSSAPLELPRVLRPWFVLAILAGCGEQGQPSPSASTDGPPQSASGEQARALGLAPWHADFPFEVALSPRVPGRWYDRSKRQALAQIVANLQGNCTQSAWQFARFFFDRAPPGAAELLADAVERHFTSPGLAAYLENLADAMARTGDESVAPSLLRMLDHPSSAVAARAAGALVTCGTPPVLRAAEPKIERATLRARCDWLRAVARKAPEDVVAVFARYLASPQLFAGVLQAILEEAGKLPPDVGKRIVEPLLDPRAGTPDAAVVAAGILHRAGDRRGTARLRELMRGDNPKLMAAAVTTAAQGDLALLLDDIYKLSLYEDGEVRVAVAQVLSTVTGDTADETLSSLGADVVPAVRQVALRALAARGKRYHLDQLIDRVRTGSGTNLSSALHDISASGDPQALSVIYERYKTVPIDERRSYMQALAYSRVPSVFPYLVEIFFGTEEVLAASGLTTMASAALLMANIEGGLPLVIELFGKVPPTDYRRRAHLLRAVANFAGFQDKAALRQPALDLYRKVTSDRGEIPQMRLFALGQHRRYLSLDDAMTLKTALADEPEPMRWALSDMLFEFF